MVKLFIMVLSLCFLLFELAAFLAMVAQQGRSRAPQRINFVSPKSEQLKFSKPKMCLNVRAARAGQRGPSTEAPAGLRVLPSPTLRKRRARENSKADKDCFD